MCERNRPNPTSLTVLSGPMTHPTSSTVSLKNSLCMNALDLPPVCTDSHFWFQHGAVSGKGNLQEGSMELVQYPSIYLSVLCCDPKVYRDNANVNSSGFKDCQSLARNMDVQKVTHHCRRNLCQCEIAPNHPYCTWPQKNYTANKSLSYSSQKEGTINQVLVIAE